MVEIDLIQKVYLLQSKIQTFKNVDHAKHDLFRAEIPQSKQKKETHFELGHMHKVNELLHHEVKDRTLKNADFTNYELLSDEIAQSDSEKTQMDPFRKEIAAFYDVNRRSRPRKRGKILADGD